MSTLHRPSAVIDPAAIQTTVLHNGVRFTMPNRTGGWMRTTGQILLLISIITAGMGAVWVGFTLQTAIGATGFSAVFNYAFAAIGLLPIAIGCVLCIVGFNLLSGRSHCEVSITPGTLRLTERVGPLRLNFQRPLEKITRLAIETSGNDETSDNDDDAHASKQVVRRANTQDVPALVVYCGLDQKLIIGTGYPPVLLRELGRGVQQELNTRITHHNIPLANADQDGAAATTFTSRNKRGRRTVELVETSRAANNARSKLRPRATRPAGTDITLERNGHELNVYVPPKGLSKGSGGLFTFAIIWLLVIGIMSAIWVPIWWSQGGLMLLVSFAIIPFWLIGIGVGLAAWNLGKRQAFIDIIDGVVLVSRKGIFGIKQREFDVDDISDIKAGRSGIEVNNQPLLELQFVTESQGTYGMLSQRDDAELHWLAHELREHIGLHRAQADSKFSSSENDDDT